jgi:hypothetical protein
MSVADLATAKQGKVREMHKSNPSDITGQAEQPARPSKSNHNVWPHNVDTNAKRAIKTTSHSNTTSKQVAARQAGIGNTLSEFGCAQNKACKQNISDWPPSMQAPFILQVHPVLLLGANCRLACRCRPTQSHVHLSTSCMGCKDGCTGCKDGEPLPQQLECGRAHGPGE